MKRWIVGMLAVMGIYLRDEKDEFLRWMTIQSMLWAMGVVLALTTVVGFLQNFAGVVEALRVSKEGSAEGGSA